jgi:hypothetical protein
MNRSLSVPLVCLAAVGIVRAQNYSYSPIAYATAEGGGVSTVPFSQSQVRMQCVHGDLRGPVRIVTALSFRRDGTATQVTGQSRQLDMELIVGNANYANVGIDFAANFTGSQQTAIARRIVSTPNWQNAPTTPPSPFDFVLTFDAPWPYLGLEDFAYEIRIHSSTAPTTDAFRADYASPTFANATGATFGTACRSTGASQNYQLLGTIGALSNNEYRFGPQGFPTPPNCPLNVLLVGASNPNLTVPGLCTTLHSSGEVVAPMPASDANGTWTQWLLYFPGNPSFAGVSLYWQAVSLDAGQPGLGLVLTAGRQLVLQAIPAGNAALAKRVTHGSNVAATLAQSVSDGGLVVRLTH